MDGARASCAGSLGGGISAGVELSVEIPQRLRDNAREMSGPDAGLAAWGQRTALQVLESLRGTRIGVAWGGIYNTVAADPLLEHSWEAKLGPQEFPLAYAERSRALARERVEKAEVPPGSGMLVAFEFTGQNAAA